MYDHPGAFGGMYLDHQSGGQIVVLQVDSKEASRREEWASLIPSNVDMTVRSVENSYAELSRAAAALIDAWGDLVASGISVTSVGVDEIGNVVRVGVDGRKNGDLRALTSVAGTDAVSVVERAAATDSACSRSGACSPIRGGVRIKPPTTGCSAGFVARDDSSRYLISAGHCAADTPNSPWRLWNDDYVGTLHQAAYGNGVDADAMEISIANPSTDNLLYISEALGSRDMTARRSNSAQGYGDVVCRSSQSGYTCGVIIERNVTITTNHGTRDHQWAADFGSTGGNSGGAIFSGSSWFGIVGSTNAPDYTVTWYGTVLWVEDVLNVTACTNPTCAY